MPKPMANGERQESITAIGSDGSNAAAMFPKINYRRTFLTCGGVFALWASPPFLLWLIVARTIAKNHQQTPVHK